MFVKIDLRKGEEIKFLDQCWMVSFMKAINTPIFLSRSLVVESPEEVILHMLI